MRWQFHLSLLVILTYAPLAYAEGSEQLMSDLTIYLQPPILGKGGTVTIVPQEVAMERWKETSGGENPAKSDDFLRANKSIPAGAKRLGAVISDEVSIVQVDYPQGGTFQFRFAPAPAPGSGFAYRDLKTKQIGVGGEGEELDEKTGEIIKVGTAIHVHIVGTDVTEGDSRAIESEIKIGALQSRYECRSFESVLVCDASQEAKP